MNFKVLNKSELIAGNKDLVGGGRENDLTALRRTLFSGDCVEELTNKASKVFILDEFLTDVNCLKEFESSVARIKKVV